MGTKESIILTFAGAVEADSVGKHIWAFLIGQVYGSFNLVTSKYLKLFLFLFVVLIGYIEVSEIVFVFVVLIGRWLIHLAGRSSATTHYGFVGFPGVREG